MIFMNTIVRTALTLAAAGALLTLAEQLLPHSDVRKTAKAAIGLIFLATAAEQIAGIFR